MSTLQLQLDATVMPNGMLTVSLPAPWQSRRVKVVVEEQAGEQADNNCLPDKVSPELYGSIWEVGDILSPIDVQWEAMQ